MEPFTHPIGHVSGPGAPHPVQLFVDDEGRLALTCTVDGHGWRLADAVRTVRSTRAQADGLAGEDGHGMQDGPSLLVPGQGPGASVMPADGEPVDTVAVARALLRS
jgi:hypothetical protein